MPAERTVGDILLLEVDPLPAKEPRIYRKSAGTNESEGGTNCAKQNAGTQIVMLNEDPEDGNRDNQKSGDRSPQSDDEQGPVRDREQTKNHGGISDLTGLECFYSIDKERSPGNNPH